MVTGRQLATRTCRVIAGIALLCLTSSCAHHLASVPEPETLPSLQLATGDVSASAALATTTTPDLIALTDEMRDFVDRYAGRGVQRQRLNSLHRALLSPALLGMEYDPEVEGSAANAFDLARANCLTYAHLFVALARYARLDARYMSSTLRPEWSRHGERVALRQHVNVTVHLRNGEQYMVDIEPVSRERVASTRELSDVDASALYHGNLAMNALLQERSDEAYAHALRAIELAERLDYLWVNLGAIYRQAGQEAAAERVYHAALDLNPRSSSAMNNLAVLYQAQGEVVLAEEWEARVLKYRLSNPYYHYFLGAQSEADGDYQQAITHYREAIALKDSDAEFYFRLGKLYYSLQQHSESIRYVEQAIERSRLVAERALYQAFLEQISQPSVAGVKH